VKPVPRADDHPLRVTALAVFSIWSAYGLLLFFQMWLNRPPTVPPPWKPYGPLLLWMGSAWVWAAFTPLIAWLVRRFNPRLIRPASLLPHVVALIFIHAVSTVVDAVGFYFVTRRFSIPLDRFSVGFAGTILLYSTVCLAVIALEQARNARERAVRAAQLEADLTRARLETLRRQLQPHFLFNTLNTISELIDTDPLRAGIMVARLGELLRRSLDEQDRSLIPLHAELDFVRLYTEIERVRFESWLDIIENVEAGIADAQVPPMILQPLVENAIKHGIAPSKRKGTVTIRARRAGERLQLEVIDDGVGHTFDEVQWRNGIGLSTTRERLAHLFPDSAMHITSERGRGTRVEVDLPFITHAA
jgi:two-component system, LytTR family, sensor kinase